MNRELLDAVPLWGLFAASFVLIWLALEGGYRLGKWRHRASRRKKTPRWARWWPQFWGCWRSCRLQPPHAFCEKHREDTALSGPLSDQHPRLVDGTVADAAPAGHARRHPGCRAGPPGGDGLRLGLVPERLADRPGWSAGLPRQSGVAQRVPRDAARLARGRYSRVRFCHHRLHGARAAGGACESLRILAAARANPTINRSSSFTLGCWPCCVSRRCATAGGNCFPANPRGKATGRRIASWSLVGRAPAAAIFRGLLICPTLGCPLILARSSRHAIPSDGLIKYGVIKAAEPASIAMNKP